MMMQHSVLMQMQGAYWPLWAAIFQRQSVFVMDGFSLVQKIYQVFQQKKHIFRTIRFEIVIFALVTQKNKILIVF